MRGRLRKELRAAEQRQGVYQLWRDCEHWFSDVVVVVQVVSGACDSLQEGRAW